MALAPDGHTLAAGACWASGWRDYLTDHVNRMGNVTGLSMIETDGPYGGYACSNASHIHHHGEGDSVYMQVRGQGDFYRELRDKGFFINDRPARPNRALLCAPRTLNDTGHSRAMLSACGKRK